MNEKKTCANFSPMHEFSEFVFFCVCFLTLCNPNQHLHNHDLKIMCIKNPYILLTEHISFSLI